MLPSSTKLTILQRGVAQKCAVFCTLHYQHYCYSIYSRLVGQENLSEDRP